MNYMNYASIPPEQSMLVPPKILKPLGPDTKSDFGFQKNPVSKNRKK